MRPRSVNSPASHAHVRLVSPLREEVAVSDAALIIALRTGDTSAARALFDRHAEVVRRMLRRMLGSRADAEDAVQEVFICFFRQSLQIEKPEAARSYLLGIALRVARSELRRRRVRSWFSLRDDEEDPRMLEAPALEEAREPLARLERVLKEVGDDARILFVARRVEGLELEEIADALGVSVSTAKRRLKRAIQLVEARALRDPLLAEYMQSRARGDGHDGP